MSTSKKSTLKNLILSRLRNFLCVFSGEDYTIIRKCSLNIQVYFSLIGAFVLAILISCFLSAMYFTDMLFHNKILDVIVGLFWGYVITNMYVLLLYTITPSLLPIKKNENAVRYDSFQLSLSLGLRVFMMILVAIIIAQPLNIFIFSPKTDAIAGSIKNLLNTNILAWFITVGVVLIFLFPIYLKYSIRKFDEFYETKESIHKGLVQEEYATFKRIYKSILEDNIVKYNRNISPNLKSHLEKLKVANPELYKIYLLEIEKELEYEILEKFEYWEDAPFRTIRKSVSESTLSENDLLKLIYSEVE